MNIEKLNNVVNILCHYTRFCNYRKNKILFCSFSLIIVFFIITFKYKNPKQLSLTSFETIFKTYICSLLFLSSLYFEQVHSLIESMNTFEADAIQACKKGDVNLITKIMTNSYSSLITNNNDRYGYRNNTHNDWNNGADENSRCPLLTRETQIKCRHMLDMPIRQLNQHRLQSAVERKNVQDIIECTIDIKKLYFHTYTNLNDFNLDRLSILRNIPNNNNDNNSTFKN